MLSPVEAAALDRGQTLKRYVRAAAALRGLFEDTEIADAVDVGRGAVAGWWGGAQMKPDTLRKVAGATGLSPEELTAFVYFDGPPPTLPEPGLFPVLEGAAKARELLEHEVPNTRPSQPPKRARGSEAERG